MIGGIVRLLEVLPLRVNAIFFAVCLSLLAALTASGALVNQSYAEKAASWTRTLDEIALAAGLDDATTRAAKGAAGEWVHLGPCEGSSDALPARTFSSAGLVMGFDPKNDFEAVVMQMIGFLSSDNLGRKPSEAMCQFALETAAN